ncbi:MAG: J domain-containing protein [Anaerolineae bacterium]|nr:J domain-containing protein [Anaerolineae bacterium]
MASEPTYYDVLGVPRDISQEQLRCVWRGLSSVYHPDKKLMGPSFGDDKFKQIKQAYEVLGDVDKRAEYDRQLALIEAAQAAAAVPPVLVIEPAEIDLGAVPLGQTRAVTFVIHNRGGAPKGQISLIPGVIDSWYQVEAVSAASESDYFPLQVRVFVNTQSLMVGQRVQGRIDVYVDTVTARFCLGMKVGAPADEAELYELDAAESKPVLAELWDLVKEVPLKLMVMRLVNLLTLLFFALLAVLGLAASAWKLIGLIQAVTPILILLHVLMRRHDELGTPLTVAVTLTFLLAAYALVRVAIQFVRIWELVPPAEWPQIYLSGLAIPILCVLPTTVMLIVHAQWSGKIVKWEALAGLTLVLVVVCAICLQLSMAEFSIILNG